MKGVHVDLTPQIMAHARSGGHDISGAAIVSLSQTLNLLLDLDPATMKIGFALGGGRFGGLDQALDLLNPRAERIAA